MLPMLPITQDTPLIPKVVATGAIGFLASYSIQVLSANEYPHDFHANIGMTCALITLVQNVFSKTLQIAYITPPYSTLLSFLGSFTCTLHVLENLQLETPVSFINKLALFTLCASLASFNS